MHTFPIVWSFGGEVGCCVKPIFKPFMSILVTLSIDVMLSLPSQYIPVPVGRRHLRSRCGRSLFVMSAASSSAPPLPTLSELASAKKPSVSAKRRILKKNDSDIKVTRAIRDNFGDLSLHARTAKLVGGQTLRARLKSEFAKAKAMLAKTGGKKKGRQAKSVNIGEKLYNKIRKEYADQTDPEAALEIPHDRQVCSGPNVTGIPPRSRFRSVFNSFFFFFPLRAFRHKKNPHGFQEEEFLNLRPQTDDSSEVVTQGLKDALICEKKKGGRKHRMLASYLASCETLNTTELVGVVRMMMKMKPEIDDHHRHTVKAFMEAMIRMDLHKTKEVGASRAVMDGCVVSLWSTAKRLGTEPVDFVVENSELIGLVSSPGDMLQILRSTSDHEKLSSVIMRLVGESKIAEALLSWTLPLVQRCRASTIIADTIKEASDVDLTSMVMPGIRSKVWAALESELAVESLGGHHSFKLQYRDLVLDITVQSLAEEVDISLAAVVKGRAVEAEYLPQFLCEATLVGRVPAAPTKKVDPAMVKSYKQARQRASYLVEVEDGIASSIKVLSSSIGDLKAFDATFDIELALIRQASGSIGEQKLTAALLDCLPTLGEERSCILVSYTREMSPARRRQK